MQSGEAGLNWEIVGGLIGLLGGIAGLYAGLKTAKSKRERRLVLGYAAFVVFLTVVLLACNFYLPFLYSYLVVIPYVVIVLLCTLWFCWRAKRLRVEANQKTS
jgi:uncharacterized membrane protein